MSDEAKIQLMIAIPSVIMGIACGLLLSKVF